MICFMPIIILYFTEFVNIFCHSYYTLGRFFFADFVKSRIRKYINTIHIIYIMDRYLFIYKLNKLSLLAFKQKDMLKLDAACARLGKQLFAVKAEKPGLFPVLFFGQRRRQHNGGIMT